jgi:DNA polymerase-3 subunit alpha
LAIGTVADKGTIDDIGRALEYPLDKVKEIKKEYEENPVLCKEKYKELFYYFDGIVGTAVSQSMHPAGIIASPITLSDHYGTFLSDEMTILSLDMEAVHEVGLAKYDILG